MCPYHRKVWPTPHTPQGEHRRSGARKLSSAQVRASALLSLTLPKGSFTRMSFSSFDAVGFALTEGGERTSFLSFFGRLQVQRLNY